MKITQFDRAVCRAVAEKALAALAPVADSFGIHISKKPGAYTGSTYTMKIEFSAINGEGIPQTKIRQDFLSQCFRFGLKPEWLDQIFTSPSTGLRFKITGMKPRSRMYPVLAEQLGTRKSYKFSAFLIRQAMEKINE